MQIVIVCTHMNDYELHLATLHYPPLLVLITNTAQNIAGSHGLFLCLLQG